jgi:GTP cyclohydrolase I
MPNVDREALAHAVAAMLRALGQDERAPALAGTPERVANLWADELHDGYAREPSAILGDAIEVAEDAPVVRLDGLATHVVCPHHLTLAIGHADVAYIPAGRVVGLGAIAGLVDAFAHRLALQEDVGREVAGALVDHLGARAAAVGFRLSHPCLGLHGEKKREATVQTLAFAGTAARPGDDRTLLLATMAMSSATHKAGA